MLRVSVVREILNSRISAFAAETSNPSATEPPTTDAFRNPRRVSSMGPPPRGKTGSSYFGPIPYLWRAVVKKIFAPRNDVRRLRQEAVRSLRGCEYTLKRDPRRN